MQIEGVGGQQSPAVSAASSVISVWHRKPHHAVLCAVRRDAYRSARHPLRRPIGRNLYRILVGVVLSYVEAELSEVILLCHTIEKSIIWRGLPIGVAGMNIRAEGLTE